jgi:hypothetical protein
MSAKRLNTRIERQAALDSRVWKELTEGAVAVLIKSPQKCDGCGKTLEMGDISTWDRVQIPALIAC